jgi:hypothetical protein
MDIPLFGLALLTFAVMYLALTVFRFWTIVFSIMVILLFLAIRWRSVAENYPHGLGDTLTLVVLVGITWILFIFLGPKDPVPVLGGMGGYPEGLTYGTPPWGTIFTIAVVFAFILMIFFAVLIPILQGRMSVGGGGGGDSMGGGKPKIGVGSG